MSRFHPREHARQDLRERLEAFCNFSFFFFPLSSLGYEEPRFTENDARRASTTKEDGEMTRYHGIMYRSSYFHRSKVE